VFFELIKVPLLVSELYIHHLLVYAVNLLGGNVHYIKKALVARREVGFSNWIP